MDLITEINISTSRSDVNKPKYIHSISYKFKYAKNIVRFGNEFFVVDHDETAIFVLSTVDGKMLRTIGRSTNPEFPHLVYPNNLYVTDDKLFVSDKNGVHIFDPHTRAYLRQFPFNFESANAICMSPDKIFISDGNSIGVFSRINYNYLDTIGEIGEYTLKNVSSICFFGDKLYVADEELCQVLIVDTRGNYINSIGHFSTPKSIFISSCRNELFVANTYNNQTVVFDSTTHEHRYTITDLDYVYSIYSVDNELYIINGNKLHVFTL